MVCLSRGALSLLGSSHKLPSIGAKVVLHTESGVAIYGCICGKLHRFGQADSLEYAIDPLEVLLKLCEEKGG